MSTTLAPILTLLGVVGHIDQQTLVTTQFGNFGSIDYLRHEAMFEGQTSKNHPYRVPCQIIAPTPPQNGKGLLLLDWLNPTGIFLPAIGNEGPLARLMLGDPFLFSCGIAYATVRADVRGLGLRWLDGVFTPTGEVIQSIEDEPEIVAQFVRALTSDPTAKQCVGPVTRRAAFAYSHSGTLLRALLRRSRLAQGLFDFTLTGGAGAQIVFPTPNGQHSQYDGTPPPQGTGLAIEFNPESEVFWREAAQARAAAPNLRVYEIAGAPHLRREDAVRAGILDAETTNPLDWYGMIRALFDAANKWCDGVQPPASIWLGDPGDPTIIRDTKGNALVCRVDGIPVNTQALRPPEVAVGDNQYIAFDPSYPMDNLDQLLRAICGRVVDLSGTFASHADYVRQIVDHAEDLRLRRYLLKEDAAAIICRAAHSSIGGP